MTCSHGRRRIVVCISSTAMNASCIRYAMSEMSSIALLVMVIELSSRSKAKWGWCLSCTKGQYLDTETGLAYNRFRYYSPETGAYISQDPIRLEAGLTNLYAYVHDVNAWIDPWGLKSDYIQIPRILGYQKHHTEINKASFIR